MFRLGIPVSPRGVTVKVCRKAGVNGFLVLDKSFNLILVYRKNLTVVTQRSVPYYELF